MGLKLKGATKKRKRNIDYQTIMLVNILSTGGSPMVLVSNRFVSRSGTVYHGPLKMTSLEEVNRSRAASEVASEPEAADTHQKLTGKPIFE